MYIVLADKGPLVPRGTSPNSTTVIILATNNERKAVATARNPEELGYNLGTEDGARVWIINMTMEHPYLASVDPIDQQILVFQRLRVRGVWEENVGDVRFWKTLEGKKEPAVAS